MEMVLEPESVDLVIIPHKFTEQDKQTTIEAIGLSAKGEVHCCAMSPHFK